jgi:hypothetical protein
VIFPPGWLSAATIPLTTGSPTPAKTIGTVDVSCWTATVAGVEPVTMTSGCGPANSCASARIRLMSPPAHRKSIRTLRPSAQPKSASACVNAETKVFHTGSFSSPAISTPMRRMRSGCCARATSGQAAAPTSPAMNSRRLIRLPRPQWRAGSAEWEGRAPWPFSN